MHPRALIPASLVVLGLGGLACGNARQVSDMGGQVATACTTCHGGEDNQTGAPPRDVSSRSDPSLASVGAHTAHVQAGALAGAFDCDACHVKPTEVTSPGHADGTTQITFGTLATANGTLAPRYDARTTGCATTYCHGNFPAGNAWNAPVWTAGSSQAACGTCHGNPLATPSALPRSAHAPLAAGSTNATCKVCHAATVKADGTVDVAGGKHVNGSVDVDPEAVHPFGWLDPSSPNFHRDPASPACFRCHTLDAPAQVTTIVCNGCHGYVALHLRLFP